MGAGSRAIPLFPFYATSYLRAYVLNAAVISTTTVVGLFLHDRQRDLTAPLGSYLSVWAVAFVCTVLVYTLFYVFFSFGGGMLAAPGDDKIPFM